MGYAGSPVAQVGPLVSMVACTTDERMDGPVLSFPLDARSPAEDAWLFPRTIRRTGATGTVLLVMA
jgi:hypothetical protein